MTVETGLVVLTPHTHFPALLRPVREQTMEKKPDIEDRSEDAGDVKASSSISMKVMDLGVWRVLMEEKPFRPMDQIKKAATEDAAVIIRLMNDVYQISPQMFSLMFLIKIWNSVEPVIQLYLSGRLLNIIEIGLKEGKPDARAIIFAVATRLFFIFIAALVEWWSDRARPSMKSRTTMFFDAHVLRSKLRIDLPTSQDNTHEESSPAQAWSTFSTLLNFTTNAFSVVSQLGFLLTMSRSSSQGPVFALLCIAKPLLKVAYQRTLWSKPHVVQTVNDDYVRLRALKKMGTEHYRQDVISGNIMNYILKEFEKARKALGEIVTDSPHSIYAASQGVTSVVISDLAGDLPMIYYAAIAILNPSKLSLTSIAMLQQSSSLLRSTFYAMFYDVSDIRRQINDVKRLYSIESISLAIEDGELNYPPLSLLDDKPKGMSFELQNVTFAYPGSKASTNALNNVSLTIKPGHLVVIVGANGSGKSTIVKVLTRLYDVTSGEVLVDGHAIKKYRISDLRQATATLTQDHHLYPLSIGENIGLGDPDKVANMDLVEKSARKGGANEFISKLAEGYSTVLDPQTVQFGVYVTKNDKGPLAAELEKLKKTIDVSGGERQRLVASRTFMRFNSDGVKFVAVDEPSSALDPEGELQLFDNLRSIREGKTMVFVTHRFGHLTKHADQIICMKDGSVIESGTHSELMALDGEYMKLYNIQASAFEK